MYKEMTTDIQSPFNRQENMQYRLEIRFYLGGNKKW